MNLNEIESKLEEVRSKIESATTDEELKKLSNDVKDLEAKRNEYISKKEEELRKQEAEITEREKTLNAQLENRDAKILGTYGIKQEEKKEGANLKDEVRKRIEEKAEQLRNRKSVVFDSEELDELRAITVSNSNIIVPKHQASEINQTFQQVSSLVDMVDVTLLEGGDTYDEPFEVEVEEGGYTDENGQYHEAETKFDHVEMKRAKITAYSEVSEEVTKLPQLNYAAKILANMEKSVNKKLGKQIVCGAGDSKSITGIYNAPENVIPTDTDLEIGNIDMDTLDTIVTSYGGDESLEGAATLILNKNDLSLFTKVRKPNGDKAYKITNVQNGTGTIETVGGFTVPYSINSGANSHMSATTGAYTMAYGNVRSYGLPIFSSLEVKESTDSKFREGQICYRASLHAGGNVKSYKGFIRIKKGTTSDSNPTL